MSSLLLTQGLQKKIDSTFTFLDTNVFIYARDEADLLSFLVGSRSTFATIAPVEYEFTRGAKSIEEVVERRTFMRSISPMVLPLDTILTGHHKSKDKIIEYQEAMDLFSTVMSTVVSKRNSQYVDYLLAITALTYSKSSKENKRYILSGDAKGFPLTLFDVEGSIGFVSGKGNEKSILTLYLFSIDPNKYKSIANSILK